MSDESGRQEVYVRDYPDTGRRWQVSTGGGTEPRWSAGGEKLFFLSGFALYSSRVRTEDGFAAERPDKLFDLEGIAGPDTFYDYDVLADDSFVMIEPAPWETEPSRIEIVVHWDGQPIDK